MTSQDRPSNYPEAAAAISIDKQSRAAANHKKEDEQRGSIVYDPQLAKITGNLRAARLPDLLETFQDGAKIAAEWVNQPGGKDVKDSDGERHRAVGGHNQRMAE